MTKYRAEVQVTLYIEVEDETQDDAMYYIQDQMSFMTLHKLDTAFFDIAHVKSIKPIETEQTACYHCGSYRWSDVNGCAECGDLNDRWRE